MESQPPQHLIRINDNTYKLLKGLSQRSMDSAVQLLWKRTVDQAKLLKEWQSSVGHKSPSEYLKKQNELLLSERKGHDGQN